MAPRAKTTPPPQSEQTDQFDDDLTPEMKNLQWWNKLSRTDPKATKPFQRAGGFRGTQIDPAFRLHLMTEVFGPVGKGWGYEQLEWTIAERMIFICCRVWWVDPETGEKHFTGPQWGGTELVRRNRDGTERPDDEAFKMSTTDAIGKCMLQVGVAADIYLGMFDDSKYREESEQFFAVKSDPELSPSAISKFEAEVRDYLNDEVDDLEALDIYWRSGINERIRKIGGVDKAAQNRLITAFSTRKNEIIKRDGDEMADGQSNAADQSVPASQPPAANFTKVTAPPATPANQEIAALEKALKEDLKKADSVDAVTALWRSRYGAPIRDLEKEHKADYTRLVDLMQARKSELVRNEPDQPARQAG